MNSKLFLLGSILLISLFVFGSNLSQIVKAEVNAFAITSPVAGQNVNVGDTLQITWEKGTAQRVRIMLGQDWGANRNGWYITPNSDAVMDPDGIHPTTPDRLGIINTGSFAYKIPDNTKPFDNMYYIKVIFPDESSSTTGLFSIKGNTAGRYVKVNGVCQVVYTPGTDESGCTKPYGTGWAYMTASNTKTCMYGTWYFSSALQFFNTERECKNASGEASCKKLWYYDNTHPTCSQKEFNGLTSEYTYAGLKTFESERECKLSSKEVVEPSPGSCTTTNDCPRLVCIQAPCYQEKCIQNWCQYEVSCSSDGDCINNAKFNPFHNPWAKCQNNLCNFKQGTQVTPTCATKWTYMNVGSGSAMFCIQKQVCGSAMFINAYESQADCNKYKGSPVPNDTKCSATTITTPVTTTTTTTTTTNPTSTCAGAGQSYNPSINPAITGITGCCAGLNLVMPASCLPGMTGCTGTCQGTTTQTTTTTTTTPVVITPRAGNTCTMVWHEAGSDLLQTFPTSIGGRVCSTQFSNGSSSSYGSNNSAATCTILAGTNTCTYSNVGSGVPIQAMILNPDSAHCTIDSGFPKIIGTNARHQLTCNFNSTTTPVVTNPTQTCTCSSSSGGVAATSGTTAIPSTTNSATDTISTTKYIDLFGPDQGLFKYGDKMRIHWDARGFSPNANITISLAKGSGMLHYIGEVVVPNDPPAYFNNYTEAPLTPTFKNTISAYNWTVNSSFNGCYRIKLSVAEDGATTWQARDFSKYFVYIGDGDYTCSTQGEPFASNTSGKSITIISPNGGEALHRGDVMHVRWSTVGFPSTAKVNIRIFVNELYGNTTFQDIGTGGMVNNTGSYDWTVPTSYGDGSSFDEFQAGLEGLYKIKLQITTDTNGTIGWEATDYSSGYFCLGADSACTDPTPVTVVNPIITPTQTCTCPVVTTQTHNVCQNQQCVSVAGAGANTCTTNTDCTSSTLTCVAPTIQAGCTSSLINTALCSYSVVCPNNLNVNGLANLIPIAGDWANSGKKSIGLFDKATAIFHLRSDNTSTATDTTFVFGTPNTTWLPIAGDWDHNGTDTVGLYDPATSTFHLRNANSAGNDDLTFVFGTPNANLQPLAGDWDGNGTDSVGLYDKTTSTFYLKNSNTTGEASYTFVFGTPGWQPIAGDWEGGVADTVGLYDKTTSTFYLTNYNSEGSADVTFVFGTPNANLIPVSGNWSLGMSDSVGVYNPATSQFSLKNTNVSGSPDFNVAYGQTLLTSTGTTTTTVISTANNSTTTTTPVTTTTPTTSGPDLSACLASTSTAQLISCLEQAINQITQQIQQLQTTTPTTTTTTTTPTITIPPTWCHTFNTNLGYANSGTEEVSALHTALQQQNISYGTDSSTEYSEETGAGVVQFQSKYGITSTGFVGSATRTKLNQLYGCATTPVVTTPTVTTPVVITPVVTTPVVTTPVVTYPTTPIPVLADATVCAGIGQYYKPSESFDMIKKRGCCSGLAFSPLPAFLCSGPFCAGICDRPEAPDQTPTSSDPVHVIFPNGGADQIFRSNSTIKVKWSTNGFSSNADVKIYIGVLMNSSYDTADVLVENIKNTGSYTFTIPQDASHIPYSGSGRYKITIYVKEPNTTTWTAHDASDDYFAILNEVLCQTSTGTTTCSNPTCMATCNVVNPTPDVTLNSTCAGEGQVYDPSTSASSIFKYITGCCAGLTYVENLTSACPNHQPCGGSCQLR